MYWRVGCAWVVASALAPWAVAGCLADPSGDVAPQTNSGMSIHQCRLGSGKSLSYLSLNPPGWGLLGSPRFRVYVLPGSGCNGLAPIARRYFRGLRSGEVVVLHKPHVDVNRWMGTNPRCSPEFFRYDRLDRWAADASAFVRWHLDRYPPRPEQRVALLGISEGAELLPMVASDQPRMDLLAMVGGTGLDPLEALTLQADRQGAPNFVSDLMRRAADAKQVDDRLWAGQSLGYWRALIKWQFSHDLLNSRYAVWMAFGSEDAALPLEGLKRFQARANAQGRSLCVALFQGADHGLQRSGSDEPLQRYFAALSDVLSRKRPATQCLRPPAP